jgi:hypothetical protein
MRLSWFDELQYELVFGLRWVGRVLIARIVWIAKEVRFSREPEARRLDFAAKKRLLDPMQRPDTEIPVPGLPAWKTMTYTPPGLSARKMV